MAGEKLELEFLARMFCAVLRWWDEVMKVDAQEILLITGNLTGSLSMEMGEKVSCLNSLFKQFTYCSTYIPSRALISFH